ncbi:MAG: hypothetical protein LBJ00_16985 [Planctomycetaceae bacterium]|jgi:hypothetical protein|nr:hypothetical protein [Planctomycetaceae bacterium]
MAINFEKNENEPREFSIDDLENLDDLNIDFNVNGEDDADSIDISNFSFDVASSTDDSETNDNSNGINLGGASTLNLNKDPQGSPDINDSTQTNDINNAIDSPFADSVNVSSENDRPFADPVKTRIANLPPDFFTLLLGLALFAIIVASILLYLDVNSYGPEPMSGLPKVSP